MSAISTIANFLKLYFVLSFFVVFYTIFLYFKGFVQAKKSYRKPLGFYFRLYCNIKSKILSKILMDFDMYVLYYIINQNTHRYLSMSRHISFIICCFYQILINKYYILGALPSYKQPQIYSLSVNKLRTLMCCR